MKNNKIFTGERMIPWLNKGKALYYEHLLRYFLAGSFVKNKTVLDLGCGTGYGSYTLLLSGAKKVIGIDLSEEALEEARKNFKTKQIQFIKDDVLKLSRLKEKFDVIVAFEILEHVKAQKKLVLKAKSKLRKEGLFIVSTPNKNNYPKGNPFHQKELTFSDFEVLLKSRFKYVEIFTQYFVLSNMILPNRLGGKAVNINFDKFMSSDSELFLSQFKAANAQYFLATCSDDRIVKTNPNIISSPKVDNIDFSLGPSLVDRQIYEGIEDKKLIRSLNELRSSKTFKIWQALKKLKLI